MEKLKLITLVNIENYLEKYGNFEGNFSKLAKDNSYTSDFLAGVEPTGVFTFRNATKNKKNHGIHKAVGDVGGFIGGATISTALSAAGTAGLGMALKKKSPEIAKALIQGGKDMLGLFNPVKTRKTLKSLGEATAVVRELGAVPRLADKLEMGMSNAEDAKNLIKTIEKRKAFIQKYNEEPDKVFARGVGMVGGMAAGVLGGGLNSMSAHTQYTSGKNLQKKLNGNKL